MAVIVPDGGMDSPLNAVLAPGEPNGRLPKDGWDDATFFEWMGRLYLGGVRNVVDGLFSADASGVQTECEFERFPRSTVATRYDQAHRTGTDMTPDQTDWPCIPRIINSNGGPTRAPTWKQRIMSLLWAASTHSHDIQRRSLSR